MAGTRGLYEKADAETKAIKEAYEDAQAAAWAEINEFNLKKDMPSDVKDFYFRSTMDKLQTSEERKVMDAAQALLEVRRRELQELTKAYGNAFAELGQAESAWSHSRGVIMAWATVLSVLGSVIGLLASFQVTKWRIDSAVEATFTRFASGAAAEPAAAAAGLSGGEPPAVAAGSLLALEKSMGAATEQLAQATAEIKAAAAQAQEERALFESNGAHAIADRLAALALATEMLQQSFEDMAKQRLGPGRGLGAGVSLGRRGDVLTRASEPTKVVASVLICYTVLALSGVVR